MKKAFLIFGIMVFALSSIVSNGGSDAPVKSATKTVVRDDLNIVTDVEPVGFHPLRTNDSASATINVQIYETLFVRSFDGMSYTPLLAESYTTPDDKTWEIKLREGIKFHDGTPFNAEAVKFTFEKIKNPEYGSARASLAESIEEVKVISEYVVQFKTTYPDGVMLAKLSHANGAIVSPQAEENQDLMVMPVGTGPYKFVEFVSGSHVILESNEEYWGGVPFIKSVRMDIVPEIATAISKLETGEADFFEGISAEYLSRVKNMSNVNLVADPSGRVNYMGIRSFSSKSGSTENIDVRKAITYALDLQGFAATQNGLALPSKSLIGPKVFGFTKNSETYGVDFDMAKAKSIVSENNFADKPLYILTANRSYYTAAAEFIQASLLEAGFRTVEIEVLEWGAYLTEAQKENRMDLFVLGWSNLTGDGSELVYPNWHSDNIGGGNRSRYSNPVFDKYVMDSKMTLNVADRLAALDAANKTIIEDFSVVTLDHGFNVYAYANDLMDIPMDPGGNFYINTIKRK